MQHELMKQGENLIQRTNQGSPEGGEPYVKESNPDYRYPTSTDEVARLSLNERMERQRKCLARMTHRTCQILKRIVDDYSHLVCANEPGLLLLCVAMAGLVPEGDRDTAWAICRALDANT